MYLNIHSYNVTNNLVEIIANYMSLVEPDVIFLASRIESHSVHVRVNLTTCKK